jgi:hypothetical protein
MPKAPLSNSGKSPTGTFLLALVLLACQGRSEQGPKARSPTLDYQPPAPTTADGRTVGADNVRPADKLEEGPRVGSENRLAPGWKVNKQGLSYDPKARVGGAISVPKVDEKSH